MPTFPRLVAGLLLLAGCAGQPPAPLVPARKVMIASAAVVPSAPIPMRDEKISRPLAMPPVDDLRLPSERRCLLKAAKLDYARLRLKPDGADFAFVTKVVDARVQVTADPVGTGLFVELEKGPVTLSGVTPAANMAVYAKRPIALGGFFFPQGDTDLRIAGASEGQVLLELPETPFDLRDVTTMLRNDVPCDAASLVATRMNARASLGKAIGMAYLLGGGIPLSLTPKGEPVATLHPESRAVELLERTEGAARIVWRASGGYVSGWVPAAQLGRTAKPDDRFRGQIGSLQAYGDVGVRQRLVCKRDVPLGVKIGEEARFVGRIRAGAVIENWGAAGPVDWAHVSMPAAEIHLLNGARLFVRSGDIAGCAPAPSASQPWGRSRDRRGD